MPLLFEIDEGNPNPYEMLYNQILQRIFDNWNANKQDDFYLWISVPDIEKFAEDLCYEGREADILIKNVLSTLGCSDVVYSSRSLGSIEHRRVPRGLAKKFKEKFIWGQPATSAGVTPGAPVQAAVPVSPTQRPLQQLNVEFDPAIPTVITYRDDNGADITTTGYFRELTVKGVLRFTFGVLLLGFLVGVAVFIV